LVIFLGKHLCLGQNWIQNSSKTPPSSLGCWPFFVGWFPRWATRKKKS